MLIRKENIKFTGQPTNINFTLSSNDDFLGYQQEIDNMVKIASDNSINSVIDTEVRRFTNEKYTNFDFYFYNYNLPYGWENSFTPAGFKNLNKNDNQIQNSFFILDFYDTYDINTQKKIFRTYLTKLITNNTIPRYGVSVSPISVSQLTKWCVPISYINKHVGEIVTGYTKILFYSGINSNVISFFNKDNENLSTPEKMYFKTELNINNNSWKINNNYVNAYELINTDLLNRMNNTVTKTENIKQKYNPETDGKSFDPSTGLYI